MDEIIVRQKQQKYWAVRKGRKPGVYTDVDEYRAQIDGFSGYSARVFFDEQEAKDFVAGKITQTELSEKKHRNFKAIPVPLSEKNQSNWDLRWRAAQTVAAYVDGCHDDELNKCGYGVCITTGDGREILLNGVSREASKTGLRSVASEITGCMAAIEWAIQKKVKKLIIVYDCLAITETIEAGDTNNDPFKKKLISVYKAAKSNGMNIEFKKIAGHVGNQYGDLTDALSRLALGKDIKYNLRQQINKLGVKNWEECRPKEKVKKPKPKLKKEVYDNLTSKSSIYKIDFTKNAVIRGNVLSVKRDGVVITEIIASFQGVFSNIPREEFGKSVFMHRENAEQKRNEWWNS